MGYFISLTLSNSGNKKNRCFGGWITTRQNKIQ